MSGIRTVQNYAVRPGILTRIDQKFKNKIKVTESISKTETAIFRIRFLFFYYNEATKYRLTLIPEFLFVEKCTVSCNFWTKYHQK